MSYLLLLAPLLGAPSPLWGDLEAGPYRVGFERIEAYDHSRPYRTGPENRARPITLSIWYPTPGPGEDAAVPFGRYVGDDGRESFARRLRTYGFSLSSAELEKVLSSPTAAFEGAPHAAGPFPLLVFGTALTGPSYLNSVLSEYLASHGYVVVALPSLPPREGSDSDYDLLAVDAQMRDMEFAIQVMYDYPETVIDKMGLVAWSFGGVPQALLQMKNPDVAAVVSLDAATGYLYGQKLLEGSLFFEPRRATAAFFHASDSRESGPVPKSFRYYDDIARGPSYLLTLDGAAHAEFASLALLPRALIGNEGSSPALRRYRLLCLYVRAFLDAAIKEDPSAREFLSVAPTRHGFEGLILSRKGL